MFIRLLDVQEKRKDAQRIAAQVAARLSTSIHAKANLSRAAAAEAASSSSLSHSMIMAAQAAAGQIAGKMGWQQDSSVANARMQQLKANLSRASMLGTAPAQMYFESELVVNDFAQSARYHVTHRDTLAKLNELTGAAVTVTMTASPNSTTGTMTWSCVGAPSKYLPATCR